MMDRWGASQDSADARENGGVWISEDQKIPDARVFYANNGNGLSMLSHYVYSMTNVRLRELTLGCDLPSRWFNDKVGMTVSLVGRNLWVIYNKAPFDPRSPLPRVPITGGSTISCSPAPGLSASA